MSSISNRALITRCPLAAPDAGAMEKGSKGSYRFSFSEIAVTQTIPEHLRGHEVFLQAINCRVQYAVILKGDDDPELDLDATSTFDSPSEHVAPTLMPNQATKEFIPAGCDRLTFVMSPSVDESGPESAFEIWLAEVKWTGAVR